MSKYPTSAIVMTVLAIVVCILVVAHNLREGRKCRVAGGTWLSRDWVCLPIKELNYDTGRVCLVV